MAEKRRLRFGIKTAPANVTYEEMLRVWLEADQVSAIEHAWLFDHFMPIGNSDPSGPCLEGWTLLSAFAARTNRLRVGLMVTGNTYRHPAVLANMAATVDIVSRGRLDFGIGAGWNELEHSAYGIPLYEPGERIKRMGEACEVFRLLWTEHAPDFNGKYYQLKGAFCEPKPLQKPYPPIVIGGGGEQLTLRMVAKYADIWNMPSPALDVFKHKSEVLDEHCAKIGRDPSTIERSVQVGVNFDDIPGTVAQTQSFIDIGVTHIVFGLRPPFPAGIAHRVAEEIIEPLQKAYQQSVQ